MQVDATNRILLKSIFFFLKRFPFWEALSILMLFGEIEQKNKGSLGIPLWIVFLDVAILVLIGTFLSFSKLWIRQVALFAAVHLVIHSIFQACSYKTDRMMMFLVLLRYIGVIAGYLLIAGGLGEHDKVRRRKYVRAACFLFGAMLCGQAYFTGFVHSYRYVIRQYCPRPICSSTFLVVLVPVLTFFLSVCSFCFLTQSYKFREIRFATLVYAVIFIFPCDCLVINLPIAVQSWVWMRLIMSSLASIGGLAIITTITF